MNKIWRIYKTDWHRIFRAPTVLFLVVALMLLPSVYAWVNIKSIWDPYSNTSGIKVAVANEDEGTEVLKKKINVGNEIVKNLKNNHKLGWVFVDRMEAKRGVEHGEYYSYLIIPKDFSKKLSSILEANPQKPVILFGVNEKLNAVAPKITNSGASSVTIQISDNFTKTVGEAIFSAFQRVGKVLQKDLPSILNLESKIFELEQALPKIEEMGQAAIELESKLPEIRQKAQKIIELEKKIPDIQRAGESILKIEGSLPLVEEAGDQVVELQKQMGEIGRSTEILNDINNNLSTLEANLEEAINNAKAAADSNANTDENTQKLELLYKDIVGIHNRVTNTRLGLKQKIDEIEDSMSRAAGFMENDLPSVEKKIHEAAAFVRQDLPKMENDLRKTSLLIQNRLAEFENVVHSAANFARNDLPAYVEKVKIAADKIRKFRGSVNINEVIAFLQHDPQKESEFLASPVILNTKRIFPIPNYGSAMAPFYTMLALWVGGTLLVSSLRVDVEDNEHKFRSYHVYFGRLLTFLTIGCFQAGIVTFGEIFFLHTYVVNKYWYVLLSIFISIVFVCIIYTLCSVFGNIGKGLAVLLMVFQMSSSGATFPVSMTSPFFQSLSPFMPYTYAVRILREAVGGMIQEVVLRDSLILSIYIVVCFFIALILKKPLNKRLAGALESAKASKMVP
ncbi:MULTISPECIES: YhgE/Pip domain-containing protein [unclassified Bacillus (in: firmicutes)]|uniref:YhgE/Pip domain-containing protein n=1 Tax=unclassified Bacillus (in: firmicutes) TaxID=185979 RepID=UPI0008E0AF64|nr:MULTISPECIES: YhgE/Pip domain-containing protein [unclassified Bacillus (in: firmicutes)]SFA80641.1 putative membrane protein [Bacillus sp. UNCCL13]SFQ70765.1 putative membrane protein [Bacillus sp. cl95]